MAVARCKTCHHVLDGPRGIRFDAETFVVARVGYSRMVPLSRQQSEILATLLRRVELTVVHEVMWQSLFGGRKDSDVPESRVIHQIVFHLNKALRPLDLRVVSRREVGWKLLDTRRADGLLSLANRKRGRKC